MARSALLLTYDFPPMGGGIARFLGALASTYPPDGLLVSTGRVDGWVEADRTLSTPVDRIPLPSSQLKSLGGLTRWSGRALALAREHQLEFVWCGNLKPAGYPARWLHSRLGLPYGILVYGTDLLRLAQQIERSPRKRALARAILGRAAVCVANSRWTQERCLELLAGCGLSADPARVRVVCPCTDSGTFRPGLDIAPISVRYSIPAGRWLLTVARLTPHKGIDTGIRALARLKSEFPELGYLVVGSGSALDSLVELARELGVSDRVHFLGAVPDADLPALYSLAEVYLGLSRQSGVEVEGFGISLLEASATAVPVVGGRSGGVADAVADGESGMLVDSGSVEAATSAVRALLLDRTRAGELGRRGRLRVEREFTCRVMSQRIRAIADEFTGEAVRVGR